MLASPALRRIRSIAKHFITAVSDPAASSPLPMGGIDTHQTAGMSSKRRRVSQSLLGSTNEIFIVGLARTPLGSFQGGLSHLSATDLGAIAIKAAVQRAGIPLDAIGEVFMGNVCSAGLGQAPARQAALKAGLPQGIDATAVNKVCSSGLKAISLAAQTIATGQHDVVVAGGMESMSNIPYYVPSARRGARMGNATMIDGLLEDGLSDATYGIHMGECAEMCAEKYGISREQQDAHAMESVARAQRAAADGSIRWELVPVPARASSKHTQTSSSSNSGGGSGDTTNGGGEGAAGAMLTADEAVSKMKPEKLKRLTPFFRPEGGTVTAGNASPITDGAAAVVLASSDAVERYHLPVLGRILGFADAAKDPKDFPTAPALAIPAALDKAGVEQGEVDYWEINEAFSVVDLVNQKLLGLESERVNAFGGAVAIGHPIGASGARLIVTLLNVLRVKEGRVGVAAVCNGGGGGFGHGD